MLFLCMLDISDTYADLDIIDLIVKFSENLNKPVMGGFVNF